MVIIAAMITAAGWGCALGCLGEWVFGSAARVSRWRCCLRVPGRRAGPPSGERVRCAGVELVAKAEAAGGWAESGVRQGLGERRVVDAGPVGAFHGEAAQRATTDGGGEPFGRGDEHGRVARPRQQ